MRLNLYFSSELMFNLILLVWIKSAQPSYGLEVILILGKLRWLGRKCVVRRTKEDLASDH